MYILILIQLGLFIGILEGGTYAKASPISPSGLNTQVSAPMTRPDGLVQHNIIGGTRPGGGANLFHSFGEFGVPTNNIANFLNDAALPTTNILSRVTGGNPSNILGKIQTDGFGKANLFLMNPYGIVFGQNATLHVGGAAYFTTADYLRLDDGVQFTAMPSAQDALLSVAPVAVFGFLGNNSGTISVDGSTLSVEDGQTLSLVGGDITIGSSSLKAPGGKVAVASVASPGEVLADTFASAPNTNGQSFITMGNIILSEGAMLDVSGDPAGRDAAGTVIIRGGTLMMTNAMISADTIESNGAPIAVDIQVTGDLTITDTQGSPAITAQTAGSGNAGEVRISSTNVMATSSSLKEDPFSLIDTHTTGRGNAGNVYIMATGKIRATGENSGDMYFIDSGTIGQKGGHGGDVVISTEHLQLTDANINTGDYIAQISEGGTGSGGNLTIAADIVDLTDTFLATDGISEGNKAGDIDITVRDIQLKNVSGIRATENVGGGGIRIITERLFMDASSIEGGTIKGIGANVPWEGVMITAKQIEVKNGSTIKHQTFGDGAAGNIRIIATDRIILSDDPTDSGTATSPSGVLTNSVGEFNPGDQGPAGDIFIETGQLELIGGARIDSTTQSSGRGGDVTIVARNGISLVGARPEFPFEDSTTVLGSTRPSGLFSRSIGNEFCNNLCGDAGNISIFMGSLTMTDGAAINSGTTSTGKGGIITVNAANDISISGMIDDGTSGGVFSRTTGLEIGSEEGGAISLIAGRNLILSDGARVSASSEGPGQAGALVIEVTSGSITITQGKVDSGTSGTGAGGAITVHASDNISISGASSGVFSQTTGKERGSGSGGQISLASGQNLTLSDGATVSASSSGFADAGNITIGANDTTLIDKATVTTEIDKLPPGTTGNAVVLGGKIKLSAGNLIQLTDSEVTSRVQEGSGSAGSIDLDPDFIVLKNSKVLSTADRGDGGPITLIANSAILIDSFSELNADSQFGGSGKITIQSPIQNLSGTITPLPQDPVPVTALYGSRCVAGEEGRFSTFVDSKSDGLAPTPGTFLASPFFPVSSSSYARVFNTAEPLMEISENAKATSLQLMAYVPPDLFPTDDGIPSACP